ncbi:MAG: phosphatase PAP2 family protein [Hyphomicrobiaceae bacterium]
MTLLKPVERLQLALIAAVIVCDLALLWRGPMTMAATDALKPLIGGLVAAGAGLYYRHVRGEERLAVALLGTAFLIWFSCGIGTLNYLAVAFDRPLIDEMLLGWDRALGIDWPTLFVALKSTPLLGLLLTLAYASSLLQVAIVVPVLALLGKTERLDRFFLAFILSAAATIGFWAAFPSFGAATYLFATGAVTELPGAVVDQAYAKSLLALKAGMMPHIVLGEMKGLIAFPSFHTVMAVLTVYAAAAVPRAFWPAMIWNAIVLISVPVDGGHHVVDIFAGLAVAYAAIASADWICRRLARPALVGVPARRSRPDALPAA